MSNQQHNTFAVVVSPNGGLPSVQNKNSVTYWEMQTLGYEVLETGNKKYCMEYWEQCMEQLIEIEYFA